MSIFDRRPPGGKSPYENIGQGGGKIMRPAEKVDAGHVQGCGDPGCPICMPKNGRGGGALMGGGGGARTTAEIAREMDRAIAGMFTVRLGDVDIGAVEFVSVGSRMSDETQVTSEKRRARDEEKRRRGPVERYLLKTQHSVAWDDVVGNELARQALVEAIEHPVKHRELYAHYGRRPAKGVLLYGPPGTGKTMFGKAAASVLARLHGGGDAPTMLHIKGPEIQSPYVGVTEDTIRAVFAYARAYRALHGRPLVVFIDEADAILPSRDGNGTRRALPWEESNVATFLTEMDGLEDSGAFVILATNRPEAIDAAILRDGRCDRKIKVAHPDRDAAETILRKALTGVPLAEGEAIEALSWAGANAVFGSDRVVLPLATDKGARALRLSDIVNGAMLVGLVEQAKGFAFERDLAAGGPPSGLRVADMIAAVASVVAQNRGLNHTGAVLELAERDGFSVAQPMAQMAAPPRYALDDHGDAVRVQ